MVSLLGSSAGLADLELFFIASAAMDRWSAALVRDIVRAFSAGGFVLELVEEILGGEGERSGENDEEGSEE